MIDWTQSYTRPTFVGPTLTPEQCMTVGTNVALKLVSDQQYRGLYLFLVKRYYRDQTTEQFGDFAKVMALAAPSIVNVATFNADDFANCHRAAWLKLVRGLARLVALNPFDSALNQYPWADPPAGGTAKRLDMMTHHGDFFFDVPNATGAYAIYHQDFESFEKVPLGPLLPETLFLG